MDLKMSPSFTQLMGLQADNPLGQSEALHVRVLVPKWTINNQSVTIKVFEHLPTGQVAQNLYLPG